MHWKSRAEALSALGDMMAWLAKRLRVGWRGLP